MLFELDVFPYNDFTVYGFDFAGMFPWIKKKIYLKLAPRSLT